MNRQKRSSKPNFFSLARSFSSASERTAIANTTIECSKHIYSLIQEGKIQEEELCHSARVAGTLAAKNAGQFIPYCHSQTADTLRIEFTWDNHTLSIQSFVQAKTSTSLDTLAMIAVSTAALTIFDVCKEYDKGMVIGPTYLSRKSDDSK
ncbi:cyclic pyranopterin monophosphate synthase MoaC [Alkalicoccobacillus gibsonii]|jgi:cyclic pyranopterin phosphate synthase|uniref:Cyclic pyranopterin monophosphate synthase MoaC n=1 Tax=Alkalicoccobacillus gibsonii TaxID=79881 RepID=A0ABU9VM46_9BACI|nr:cyclic pyranopterin monophosphate synthase MoaC [Alkalicoccobacillus gibsonii]MBM0067238.1 cyclic pyranopterin monophosphate synthase MoaC [Alkalicoccobacillus gibsonii]